MQSHQEVLPDVLLAIPAVGNGRKALEQRARITGHVSDVLQAGERTGKHTDGQFCRKFEADFAKFVGAAAAVGTSSGTAALRLAIESQRFPPGSEIVVPALSFISTAFAISDSFALDLGSGSERLVKGLIPVFADIEARTFNLDPDALLSAMTERTVAVVVSHMMGQMADMPAISRIASKHNLKIIEDAAQAAGSELKDEFSCNVWRAGSAGALASFSLNSVKNIGSFGVDAGIVTISRDTLAQNPDLVSRLRSMCNLGRMGRHRYEHQTWGMRARLDEFSALECSAQLAAFEELQQRRLSIAMEYDAALQGGPLRSPERLPGRAHTFFCYAVLCPDLAMKRAFESQLSRAGIEVMDSYTVMSEQGPYATGLLPSRRASTEVATSVSPRIAYLPCYAELTDREVERIAAVVSSFR